MYVRVLKFMTRHHSIYASKCSLIDMNRSILGDDVDSADTGRSR